MSVKKSAASELLKTWLLAALHLLEENGERQRDIEPVNPFV